jgi:hypothetical protein
LQAMKVEATKQQDLDPIKGSVEPKKDRTKAKLFTDLQANKAESTKQHDLVSSKGSEEPKKDKTKKTNLITDLPTKVVETIKQQDPLSIKDSQEPNKNKTKKINFNTDLLTNRVETTKQQNLVIPERKAQKEETETNEEKVIKEEKKIKQKLTKPQIFSPVVKDQQEELKPTLSAIKDDIVEQLSSIRLEEDIYNLFIATNFDDIDMNISKEKYNLNYWQERINKTASNPLFINTNINEVSEGKQTLLRTILYTLNNFSKYQGNINKLRMIIFSLHDPQIERMLGINLQQDFYSIFTTNSNLFDFNLGFMVYLINQRAVTHF